MVVYAAYSCLASNDLCNVLPKVSWKRLQPTTLKRKRGIENGWIDFREEAKFTDVKTAITAIMQDVNLKRTKWLLGLVDSLLNNTDNEIQSFRYFHV